MYIYQNIIIIIIKMVIILFKNKELNNRILIV